MGSEMCIRDSGLTIEARDAEPVATAMVVVLTYWLSFEYVRDPRRACLLYTSDAADDVSDVEDAWLFFHMLFELIWSYRFLYRDLNDLLSNNRKLESHFQFVLQRKTRAVTAVLDGIAAGSGLTIEARDAEPVATAMVVVLTYWLSFEYVRDPRRALEPETASAALLRGAFHVLCLLLPYLDEDQREHLHSLAARYTTPGGD